MRTTLELDQRLLEQVVELTGERNKGRAVNEALSEFVRRRKIEDLIALAGHIDLVDDLAELDEIERKEADEAQW
ncbi:MAG: type II toxin-antitoxin system VapB family antitoxin [Chloroflexi bacterium]|nr:type II toxin-antitoxin system VapB family antitoxin [Chloroflexota bacterium]